MLSDYDYYLIGCRDREILPLSRWRFTVAYGLYQRMMRWAMEDWRRLEPDRRTRIVARWNRARNLNVLVCRGRQLAAQVGRDDDFPGAAGAGDREPRVPISPVLAGCGQRPLPLPDAAPRVELWA